MNIKEIAEQAGLHIEGNWVLQDGVFVTNVTFIEHFAKLVAAAERNRCIDIIEHYQIPVGASTAGEIACEMTYEALRDIRDQINGETDDE